MTQIADIAVIIVAAGRGKRAGEGPPKQWRDLAGKSVLARTVAAFKRFARIAVVLHPDDMARGVAEFRGRVTLIAGGDSRAQSVKNALQSLDPKSISKVMIHDGARPFVKADLIDRILVALETSSAVAPALPVTDALWCGADGAVTGSVSREGLSRAQTPQAFDLAAILNAHRTHPGEAADDVEVALAAGLDVAIVAGDEDNIKITWPGDFIRAEKMIGDAVDIRTGNGFDVHAFCEGDHVMLCGVRVAHSRGLLGHSDADVGMHALTDAIYGALAEGDIGRHFPPSDSKWKDAASHIFLAHAASLAHGRGYKLANADVTLICENPKIGPYANEMASELARFVDVDASRISVKATTSERLGFTGREEGIAAIATVTLVSP
ncbi:MAG: bifunctional 2-C-methyl-D-erythritol 4-phosphate cytidylyltransferase/2-C-methyl-D-erythritol 2,4-cyclodiphosphate synthase [Albidovulum sp.]